MDRWGPTRRPQAPVSPGLLPAPPGRAKEARVTLGTAQGRTGCPGATVAALPSRAALGLRQLRAQTQGGHSQKSQRDPREALGLCHPCLGVPWQLQFQIAPYMGRSPTGSLPRKARRGESPSGGLSWPRLSCCDWHLSAWTTRGTWPSKDTFTPLL